MTIDLVDGILLFLGVLGALSFGFAVRRRFQPCVRKSKIEWGMISALVAITVVSTATFGLRSLPLLGTFMTFGLLLFTFTRSAKLTYALTLLLICGQCCISIGLWRLLSVDQWQFGRQTARSLGSQHTADLCAEDLSTRLRQLDLPRRYAGETGPLFQRSFWLTRKQKVDLPGFVSPGGTITVFLPEPAWHSGFTQLYRIRKEDAVLWFSGRGITDKRVPLVTISVKGPKP